MLTSAVYAGHEALDGLLAEEGSQQLAHAPVNFCVLDS